LAVVSAVATRASTADVDGVASEEVTAAEVASGAVVATTAVAIETDTAHRATRPLDLASTEEMVVMATEVIAATAAVTAEAIEALVGMIREAAAAHMTTDTVAAAAVATATVADSETAITDVLEATWNPSAEEKVDEKADEKVDEKVGIATGTGTTTGPATMTVAGNVAMTVATRIQGSCADTKAVFPLHGLLVGCRFSSSRH
jgi:hypothetical protein